MKKLLFLVLLLTITQFAFCQEMPLNNDTIVCIIDTNNYFTSYKENPFEKNPDFHWYVGIKGHYYDHKSAEDADFALIGFETDFRNNTWIKDPLKISVPISNLNERFTIVTDEWLNKQKDLYTIQKKIAYTPWSNYNYLIFKSNIESSTDGEVVMHRVLVGYSEISD